MEEEYIEKIEKTILKCNECKLKECIGCEYTFNELQPLRYLLKRYKELEEENAMLKKAHNISEKVTVEDITQVMNKSLEDFKKEFIPTSVIEKKIEEVNNSNGYSPVNKIFIEKVLNEILEEGRNT